MDPTTNVRRSASRGLGAALLSLVVGSAAAASETPPGDRFNVLLYVLDTTRADHFGLWGYQRNTTPHMDALAAEGLAWARCSAAGTHTISSTGALLTGVTAASHRTTRANSALSHALPTLPEMLATQGYRTKLFSSNSRLYGETRQFADRYEETIVTQRPDENLTDALIAFLREAHPEPFFVHAQPLACHVPYIAPPPFDELYVDDPYYGHLGDLPGVVDGDFCYGVARAEALIGDNLSLDWYVAQYDGLLSYMDQEVARTMAVLQEEGLRENTLVIITSDHGEMLGDHEYYLCHRTHYQANIHVPLLVIPPRAAAEREGYRAGEWLQNNVNHVDLAPTILEFLGIDVPSYFEGTSLLSGAPTPGRISEDFQTRALHYDSLKLINHSLYMQADANTELYDLASDSLEQYNLALAQPTLRAKLEEPLLSFVRECRETRPLPYPSGTFYQQDFESPDRLYSVAVDHRLSGVPALWSLAHDPNDPENIVVYGAAGTPDDPATKGDRASCLGLVMESDNPYGVELDAMLTTGKFEIGFSTNYEIRPTSILPAWGYVATIDESESQLLAFRSFGGAVRLDRAPFRFTTDEWHRLRIENDGTELRLLVDGEPVLGGAAPGNQQFHHGTTCFVVYPNTELRFDNVRQWRP